MKKTEEELKQEIMDEYSFEEGDERIDKILEVKKDRYTATQAKKKAQIDAKNFEKGKDFYKSKSTQTGTKAKKADTGKEATISPKDSARLMQADVPVDDWDEVISYAKFKNISIGDALNTSVVKTTLGENKEERKTAEASNTGGSKRGSSKVSGATLLQRAMDKNEIPESDADLDKLLDERYKPAS